MEKNKLSSEQKHSIKVRTLTGAVLVALLVPAMIFGSIYFVGVSIIIAFAFAYESRLEWLSEIQPSKDSKKMVPVFLKTEECMEERGCG